MEEQCAMKLWGLHWYCPEEVMPGSSYCYEHDHEMAGCCERDEPYDSASDEDGWRRGK